MPLNFSDKCPSLRILCLLKDDKIPVSYDIIRKHISQKYTNEQITKALDRLVRNKLIVRDGTHKDNTYTISDKGLKYFFNIDRKNIALNVSNQVFNYLMIIGGID